VLSFDIEAVWSFESSFDPLRLKKLSSKYPNNTVKKMIITKSIGNLNLVLAVRMIYGRE